MQRIYQLLIQHHLNHYRQMLILNGPRQVGKTTLAKALQQIYTPFYYLNWDIKEDREHILLGQQALANYIELSTLHSKNNTVIFDELHKYRQWKSFLKGFYDRYNENCHVIITGSQKLNVAQKSGDSLMGRYFPYRIHPFSIAECVHSTLTESTIRSPKAMSPDDFHQLWEFGGYPDPFLRNEKRFLTRWQNLREEQLFREDIANLSQIQELAQLEILAQLLKRQPGQLLNYSNLANKINVTSKTIQKWIITLENFYFCFLIRPWSKNISRSLIKEPKMYLWDWSGINDIGARTENFVACHLLKAIHFWTDAGFGKYDLFFLRTKDQQEVDFLVTENETPWFLVEAKYNHNQSISKYLHYFQQQTGATHAFQTAFTLDYVDIDCYTRKTPCIVPATTLLSQWV